MPNLPALRLFQGEGAGSDKSCLSLLRTLIFFEWRYPIGFTMAYRNFHGLLMHLISWAWFHSSQIFSV